MPAFTHEFPGGIIPTNQDNPIEFGGGGGGGGGGGDKTDKKDDADQKNADQTSSEKMCLANMDTAEKYLGY